MNAKRLLAAVLLAAYFLIFFSCSEEIYENDTHHHGKSRNSISFQKFKQKTGIRDFSTLRSFELAGANLRDVREDYLIDTLTIMYFAGPAGKDTYSFKIYPITKELNQNEYYNLIYEKSGDHWYQHIFLNKEKENPLPEEPKLESSQMIYSNKQAHFSLSYIEACQLIEANFHCTNTGPCATQGYCDGCDLCVSVTVTFFPCPTGTSGTGGQDGISVGTSGSNESAIYIPNPYNGEEDLNNPEFVFSMNVAAFTRTLPSDLKNIINSRYWMYPKIVDFMRNNGGLTQENKDAVSYALSHITPLFGVNPTNMAFTDIEILHYNGFNFLLENPNTDGNVFIQSIVMAGNELGEVDFPNKIIVKESLKNNPCLNGVYTQIGKAPTFQNYLQNFDGNFSVANLTFTVGVHPSHPTANAVTLPPENYMITIMFNPNNLHRPPLDIARTYIHEIIHAEIFRKLLSCANLPNLNVNNYSETQWQNFINNLRNNFPGLYDYYLRYQYNVPSGQQPSDAQHQAMAEHYRNIIVQALKDYDNNSHSDQFYNALAWTGLMGEGDIDASTGLPTNPTIAWQNISQTERLQILSTIHTFVTTETPCQ